VYRIRMATVAALLASFVGLQATPAGADDDQRRDRRDRYEDRWDQRNNAPRDWRNDRWNRRDARNEGRQAYWDPARSYQRADYRNRPRAMGWNDQVYRGSDNRYYCKRDDGTTGLIVGGMAGGVLGHVLAPGGSKTLGTIIGAGAGALIGRAIDDGDMVCR
jgi:Glycine zipper 2TM domain